MVLTHQKLVQRIVPALENPAVAVEFNGDEQTGIYFFRIFLTFTACTDEESLLRELLYTLKKPEAEAALKNHRIKLEDIFAKYIGEDYQKNQEFALQARKIAAEYEQIIKYHHLVAPSGQPEAGGTGEEPSLSDPSDGQ